jgi:hypothetical protein
MVIGKVLKDEEAISSYKIQVSFPSLLTDEQLASTAQLVKLKLMYSDRTHDPYGQGRR